MASVAHVRIQKDLREVNTSLNPDSPPIFAVPSGDDLEHVAGLVVGPPETPYAFGFFRFATYPNSPPRVYITTTDLGRVRFNPNLYASGKVCLSILGTWTGESADEWRSSYSIAYILRAIQSLIMTSKPYHNEPGYEEGEKTNATEVEQYSDKIKHEVLRVAVCNAAEGALLSRPDDPFSEFIKSQFLLWYDTYLARARAEISKDGTPFVTMAFEGHGNSALGKYHYASIISRLTDLKLRIEQETLSWKTQLRESSGLFYLRLLEQAEQFKTGKESVENCSAAPIQEEGGKQNVFCWEASLFGPDDSLYEGGMFRVEIVFKDEDTPPRVRFITNIWHPNITKDGYPYLVPVGANKGKVKPLLEELRALLKNPPNPSPATWANQEAANQCYSKEESQRTEFKKVVGRCVRRSMEEV